MTVEVRVPTISYVGNGTAAPLAVPFRFLHPSHLVIVAIDRNGVEAPMVRGTNYSVTGAGAADGGNVVPTAVIQPDIVWRITRVTPLQQPTRYEEGFYSAAAQEMALDRQMLALQEQARDLIALLDRAIIGQRGEGVVLPARSAMRGGNKVIGPDPVTGIVGLKDYDDLAAISKQWARAAELSAGDAESMASMVNALAMWIALVRDAGWYDSLESGAADVENGDGFVVIEDGDVSIARKEAGVPVRKASLNSRYLLRNHGINLWEEARGDGETLDQDALNSVIEDAKNWGVGTINCGGPNKVYLIGGAQTGINPGDANGRYLARLYSNLAFRGNGPGARPTFKMAGGYTNPGILFGDRWWDADGPVENVSFENIIFDGNMSAQNIPAYAAGTSDNLVAQHQRAIGLLWGKDLTVRRCAFRHWRGDGVALSTNTYVDDDVAINYSSGLTVEGCEFFDMFSIGISFDGFRLRSRGNWFHGDGYWVGAISCESLSTRGRIQDIWSESDYFDFRDGLSPVEATLRDYATGSAEAAAGRRHFRPAIALSGNYYSQNPGNVFGGQFGKVSIIQPKIRQGSILVGGFERVLIDAPDIDNVYEDIARLWPPRPHAITIQPAAGGGAVTGLSQAIIRDPSIRHDNHYHGILVTGYNVVKIDGGSIIGPRTAPIRLENCGGYVGNIELENFGIKTVRQDWKNQFPGISDSDADALIGSTSAGVVAFGARASLTIADIRAKESRTGGAIQSDYAVYVNVDDSQIVRVRDIDARGMGKVKDVQNRATISGVMDNPFPRWETNAEVIMGRAFISYGNPSFRNESDDLVIKFRAPQAKNRTLSFVDETDQIEAQIVHLADGTLQFPMFLNGVSKGVPMAFGADGTTRVNWAYTNPIQWAAPGGAYGAWQWIAADGKLRIHGAKPVTDGDGVVVGTQL